MDDISFICIDNICILLAGFMGKEHTAWFNSLCIQSFLKFDDYRLGSWQEYREQFYIRTLGLSLKCTVNQVYSIFSFSLQISLNFYGSFTYFPNVIICFLSLVPHPSSHITPNFHVIICDHDAGTPKFLSSLVARIMRNQLQFQRQHILMN